MGTRCAALAAPEEAVDQDGVRGRLGQLHAVPHGADPVRRAVVVLGARGTARVTGRPTTGGTRPQACPPPVAGLPSVPHPGPIGSPVLPLDPTHLSAG